MSSWLGDYNLEKNSKGYIKSPTGHCMELDIVIPSEKWACELNGRAFHSESDMNYLDWCALMRGKSKGQYKLVPKWLGYHQHKIDECSKIGYHLCMVCSEDVLDFPEQTRDYIMKDLREWKLRRMDGSEG